VFYAFKTACGQPLRRVAETVNEFLESGWQCAFNSFQPLSIIFGRDIPFNRLLLRRTANGDVTVNLLFIVDRSLKRAIACKIKRYKVYSLICVYRWLIRPCGETANLSRANTKSHDNIRPSIPSDLPVFRVQHTTQITVSWITERMMQAV
jgi:hypothetical protein